MEGDERAALFFGGGRDGNFDRIHRINRIWQGAEYARQPRLALAVLGPRPRRCSGWSAVLGANAAEYGRADSDRTRIQRLRSFSSSILSILLILSKLWH
jgi:hypothetical protein